MIKKILFLVLISIHAFAAALDDSALEKTSLSSKYLTHQDRPEGVRRAIRDAYLSVSCEANSSWRDNGKNEYLLGQCDDRETIGTIVRKSPEQKEFTFLDVGAGNFSWGRSVTKYLNENFSDRSLSFTIIGVRGEENREKTPLTEGVCTLYEIGRFKIEDIQEEFTKRGLVLTSKVDGIWSSWTLRHLVDPVGTFLQIRDLLRPKT